MSENVRLDTVAAIATEVHGAAPGAVVGVALRAGGGQAEVEVGAAGVLWTVRGPSEQKGPSSASPPPAVTANHIFDLASLTKMLTALAVARAVRLGRMTWEAPLEAYLPLVKGTHGGRQTLEALLSHRSGLAAHRKFFAEQPPEGINVDATMRSAASFVAAGELNAAGPPWPCLYSDLGYLLVGRALETTLGQPLDRVIEELVCGPLELAIKSARGWRLGGVAKDWFVPTEVVSWRGGLVHGEVHDGNAWALAGDGAAGHAGLFATVGEVTRLGVALLEIKTGDRPTFLSASEFARLVAPRPGGSYACGFDRKTAGGSSSGAFFGPQTFGHLGFTGTSLWVDPEKALVGCLLTNRVHPARDHIAIRAARPAVYDAMWAHVA